MRIIVLVRRMVAVVIVTVMQRDVRRIDIQRMHAELDRECAVTVRVVHMDNGVTLAKAKRKQRQPCHQKP